MNNLKIAIQAALQAGQNVLNVYQQDFDVETKADHSPLTEADKQSNAVILEHIKPTGIPIISEEIKNMEYAERSAWDLCWMVDPLDGTKEFVKKNGEFTVNIALIKDGLPVLGVVYWPVEEKLYFASKEQGSYVVTAKPNEKIEDVNTLQQKAQPLKMQDLSFPETYTIVASRSHSSPETEAFIKKCETEYEAVELVSRGSSLKLCMVAEGSAHIYPRIAPTMEWDTAAAHAVAKYAGGQVLNFETKEELSYNKENLLNPFFVVSRKNETVL